MHRHQSQNTMWLVVPIFQIESVPRLPEYIALGISDSDSLVLPLPPSSLIFVELGIWDSEYPSSGLGLHIHGVEGNMVSEARSLK